MNEWTCPKGHVNRFFLTEPFYQQLFEEAVRDLALRDTRGGRTCVLLILGNVVAHTVDILLTEFTVTVPMPSSSKRAEPRHGTFLALFLAKANTSATLPANSTAQMRNGAIHDDKMPSEEDACTGPSRSPIPEQADHPFRRKPIADSGASRSLNERPGEPPEAIASER